MNINWFSNAPWANTGYGAQTKVNVPRLAALGHKMSITAFYGLQGAPLTLGGVTNYPAGNDAYGQDVLGAHARHAGADVVISLIDAWVMRPEQWPNVKWIPWYPVDSEPCPPPVVDQIRKAYKRIAMSQFGLKMTNDAGLEAAYIPHSIDTDKYRERPRGTAREAMRWPSDKFVVGMVAANKGTLQSRKAFEPQIRAFAELNKKHPDTMLYLHTTRGLSGEGVNLEELVKVLGLRIVEWDAAKKAYTDGDVMFCDAYNNLLGFDSEYMAMAYSAMDVHMLVSMGEGFGIPTLEAQACGTPVITSGWTASEELCFSGWKISKNDADAWYTPLASYQWMPRAGAVAEALQTAYKQAAHPTMRKEARRGALRYDADKVAEKYWKPFLETVEQELANESA